MSSSEALRAAFERALKRDDVADLQELVLRVARESDDASFAEWCCTRLARHRNAILRGNALHGFGTLAQRFGDLNRRKVHRLVENGLHAHHDYVRENAESAAADLETLLAWRFERAARRTA